MARSRRVRWFLLLVGCCVNACQPTTQPGSAEAAVEPPAPAVPATDQWFGAYLQDSKIGYMHIATRPITEDGQPRIEYTSTDRVALDVLGQRMEQTSVGVVVCDPGFRPLRAHYTIRSEDRDMAVAAEFRPDVVVCQKTTGDETVEHRVPVPEGVQLVVDERAVLREQRLDVGQSVSLHQFNPITLAIEEHTLTGLRRAPLALPGETVDALVVEVSTPFYTAEAWVDEQGRMARLELPLGSAQLVFERETEEKALDGLDGGGPRVDLVAATAIRPGRHIERPRQVSRLVLRVRGLDALSSVPDDEWQAIEPLDDDSAEVTLSAEPPQPDTPPTAEELAPFLGASAYIETDHPEIQAAAADIIEGADGTARAKAEAVHDWVNRHVAWQSNIGLFRSALEILRDPAGVCRDAAALSTALARAAGVPTRVCAGLVYVDDAFLGHAWTESWDGERWVPFDATTATPFVDATHLKLAQGAEYTSVFEMLPALSSLQIEVLEVAHRTGDVEVAPDGGQEAAP